VNVFVAAIPVVVPLPVRIHEPTLIGDVTLNSRSMFRKREGTPRSEIRSGGLAVMLTSDTPQARRARTSLPLSSARYASPADAPAIPPKKKYVGISGVHTGFLMTGWP
jgi:hypothetical protein